MINFSFHSTLPSVDFYELMCVQASDDGNDENVVEQLRTIMLWYQSYKLSFVRRHLHDFYDSLSLVESCENWIEGILYLISILLWILSRQMRRDLHDYNIKFLCFFCGCIFKTFHMRNQLEAMPCISRTEYLSSWWAKKSFILFHIFFVVLLFLTNTERMFMIDYIFYCFLSL